MRFLGWLSLGLFVALAACDSQDGSSDPPIFVQMSPLERDVAVAPGAGATVHLRMRPKGFDQDLVLDAADAPAGITVDPVTVPAGATSATVTLHAAAGTPPHEVLLRLTGVSGDLRPFVFVRVAIGATGGLFDPTFGEAGCTIMPFLVRFSLSTGMVSQPDGKLVLTGNTLTNPGDTEPHGYRGLIARLDAAGSLDPSFGVGGVSPLWDRGHTVADVIQLADGRFVGLDGPILWGITAAGSLDATFGAAGRLNLGRPAYGVTATADGGARLDLPDTGTVIGLDAQGQVVTTAMHAVAVGLCDVGAATDGWVEARTTGVYPAPDMSSIWHVALDGQQDQIVPVEPGRFYAPAMLPGGGVFVAYELLDLQARGYHRSLRWYHPDGSLAVEVPTPADVFAVNPYVLPDGRVTVTLIKSGAFQGESLLVGIVRYNADGTLDETFADRGTFTPWDVPITQDTRGFGGVYRDHAGALYLSFYPTLEQWRICKLTP